MTIRFRLTIWFILVILIANSALSIFTAIHVGDTLIDEVQTRVLLDLNSARRVYNNHLETIQNALRAVEINSKIEASDFDTFKSAIQTAFELYRDDLDVLLYIDNANRVVYRAHNPATFGDTVVDNPLINLVLRDRQAARGTIILSQENLSRESIQLAKNALFEIKQTTAARPSHKILSTNGMMLAAAIPIMRSAEPENAIQGVLFGGLLLNRRFSLVDSIQSEVFQQRTHKGKTIGMATIFQDDLRIATNVLTREGERAVGTRMSAEVYRQVVEKGEVWADRAFVVNDWYITAYEPIEDPWGNIIGALYVGILEAPFKQTQFLITAVFFVSMAITTVLILFLLDYVTKRTLQPVGEIIDMAQHVIAGDLTARVQIHTSGEMGNLCRAINQMGEAVYQRELLLKKKTSEQISQSEKLASIGRLAAGVAHEINNPLTGVLTFAHLLRENERFTDQDREDLDVIIHETTRVREIVRGLLDFSRESPSSQAPLDINEAIRQTIRLLKSHKEFQKIKIEEKLCHDLPLINADKNQMQQVMLNLCLNACEAMGDNGVLTVSTTLHDNELIAIQVADTGIGIPEEHLEKIFDPFFTSKPVGKGTGLGLSVTYGIVQSHHGTIQVESEQGKGTIFTILLPAATA